MSLLPKYAQAEIERRWIVDAAAITLLDGLKFREIEDVYFSGTGLRLRKVTEINSLVIYKFGKKYGKYSKISEGTTNLYLTEMEYESLRFQLHGKAVRKQRYSIFGGSLDIYQCEELPMIFEMEFKSEAEALSYSPPNFVGEEVTGNADYSGAVLAWRAT